jgi:hypothetical protein
MAENKIIPFQQKGSSVEAETANNNEKEIKFISDSKLFGKYEIRGPFDKVNLLLRNYHMMTLLGRISRPVVCFLALITMYLIFGDRIFPLIECFIEQLSN